MGSLLTLIAECGKGASGLGDLPPGFAVRPCEPADGEVLGRLYFAAYDPGVAGETVAEAVADIEATFAGVYGPFWSEGSALALADEEPVAAILAVRRAPWEGTPDCPFVIELFTDRAYRRRGLGRALLARCLAAAGRAGETAVALRVAEENAAARALYAALGFAPWPAAPKAGGAIEPADPGGREAP